ncbi:MAG: hypothetical protein HQ488_00205 [Parcubacteria group bacterium]|nr:hypothetical protein [Parcubacteria group bacterium]
MRELYRCVLLTLCALSLLTAGCGADKAENDDDSIVSVEGSGLSDSALVPLAAPAYAQVMIGDDMSWVPPGPHRLPDVPANLLEFIERGKRLMEGARFKRMSCVPENVPDLTWKRCLGNDYLLAVVSPEGKLKRIDVYGGVATSPSNFNVRCEREGACDGGVNPPFIVNSPPGWTVVAVRKAVPDTTKQDGIGGQVYVPYSTRLNTPELRQAGLQYLHLVVEAVRYDLLAKDVRSGRIAGKHVLETTTLRHAVVLSLTEQVYNPELFVSGTDIDRLEMLNRILVLFAINREQAFRFVMSNMDARGGWQIIPASWETLRTSYPSAQLPEDFVYGSTNHSVALKAAILHTDDQWWGLKRNGCKDGHIAAFSDLSGDWGPLFAAGYNGSMARADSAYHACGANWRDGDCCKQIENPLKRLACHPLREETLMYLPKYEWIDSLLFDEEQRLRIESLVWPQLREQALAYETARAQRIIEEALVTTQ